MGHDYNKEGKSMSLSNAIAIVRRMDARILVKVPAGVGRSAYSYWREGTEKSSSQSGKVKEISQQEKAGKNLAFIDAKIKRDEQILRDAGIDVDGANKALKKSLDGAEIRIRVPDEDALNAVSDHRFKNASEFDPKEVNKAFDYETSNYMGERIKEESSLFGKTKPEDRPIYGYLKFSDDKEDTSQYGVGMYGDIIVGLKKDSKTRASFTISDSLGTGLVPSRLSNPSVVSYIPEGARDGVRRKDPETINKIISHTEKIKRLDPKELREFTKSMGSSYYEVQLHGQVMPSDISYVTSRHNEISKETRDAVKSRGIEVRNREKDGWFDSANAIEGDEPMSSDFKIESLKSRKTALAQNAIALSLQGQEYKKNKLSDTTPSRGDSSDMSLTNAIAIIRRQDAKVKVEVPATGNRKAYSYMREGNPANPKSAASKKAIAAGIGGAIGVGALTAGILAMRRSKKVGEETDESTNSNEPRKMLIGSNSTAPSQPLISSSSTESNIRGKRKAITANNVIDANAREVSNGIAGTSPKLLRGSDIVDVESREVSNAVKMSEVKGLIAEGQSTQRAKPLVTPPPSSTDRVLVTPEPAPISPKYGAGKKTKRLLENLEISPDNKKKEGLLNRGIDAFKKMTAEGVERDRKAGGAFADREIDLNKAAYSGGEISRMVAQNLATFAKASVEVFGKKQPKAVDVKATEVNEALPEGNPMKKESKAKGSKPKKAKTPKLKPPTAAERRAIQQKLNDLNK